MDSAASPDAAKAAAACLNVVRMTLLPRNPSDSLGKLVCSCGAPIAPCSSRIPRGRKRKGRKSCGPGRFTGPRGNFSNDQVTEVIFAGLFHSLTTGVKTAARSRRRGRAGDGVAAASCSRSAPTFSTTSSPATSAASTPASTRHQIQRRSRRSLPRFVPLSYDCRGVPVLAEVGDVSRMRQHVSGSLKRHRHTQTSPSAQRGPMSNRDDQNYTGQAATDPGGSHHDGRYADGLGLRVRGARHA